METGHGFKEAMANASIPPKGIEQNIYMLALWVLEEIYNTHTIFSMC